MSRLGWWRRTMCGVYCYTAEPPLKVFFYTCRLEATTVTCSPWLGVPPLLLSHMSLTKASMKTSSRRPSQVSGTPFETSVAIVVEKPHNTTKHILYWFGILQVIIVVCRSPQPAGHPPTHIIYCFCLCHSTSCTIALNSTISRWCTLFCFYFLTLNIFSSWLSKYRICLAVVLKAFTLKWISCSALVFLLIHPLKHAEV